MKKAFFFTIVTLMLLLPGLVRAGSVIIDNPGIVQSNLYSNDTGSIFTQGAVFIPSPRQVLFVASETIILKPGFKASAGSSFRAMIGSTGSNFTSKTDQDKDLIPDWWELLVCGVTSDASGLCTIEEYLENGEGAPKGIFYQYDALGRMKSIIRNP